MTGPQRLWFAQAASDFDLFARLRPASAVPVCHKLHFLQMATEKLAKAYLWRSGSPPTRTHEVFVAFLRGLVSRSESVLAPLAGAAGFGQRRAFVLWLPTVFPLAYDIERLAPALAGDGPNAEYPWPHDAPAHTPAEFPFPLWYRLTDSASGRQFLRFVAAAVQVFPTYA